MGPHRKHFILPSITSHPELCNYETMNMTQIGPIIFVKFIFGAVQLAFYSFFFMINGMVTSHFAQKCVIDFFTLATGGERSGVSAVVLQSEDWRFDPRSC